MKHHSTERPARHLVHRRLNAIFFYIAILIGVMVSFPIMVTPLQVVADINPRLDRIQPAATVSAGQAHSVLLDYDGLVYIWGDNTYHQLGMDVGDHSETPVLLELPEPAIAVSAGDYHTLVVGRSGSVYAFGRNAYGQVGNGSVTNVATPDEIPGLPPIQAVSAGSYHSLALGFDGSVWSWGHNTQGQVGPVDSEAVEGLDGNVLALRNQKPVQIVETGAIAIAAGGNFSLYLDDQAELFAWGENTKGQLGLGTQENTNTPTRIPELHQVIDFAAGTTHVLALSEQSGYRQLYVWGDHALGQLGLGKLTEQNTFVTKPVLLDITGNLDPSDERLLDVSAGSAQSAVTRDVSTARFFAPRPREQLYVWGLNGSGQLAVGDQPSQYRPVKIQGFYDGYFGDRFLPFESIAFGANHVLTLSTNGMLATAGQNDRGQLGMGSAAPQHRLTVVPVSDLILPQWVDGQAVSVRWPDDTVLQVIWPEAQDNTGVAGYWVEVAQAGQAPVLYDAGLRTKISVQGQDPQQPLQLSVFAYDDASRETERSQLARLTGYALPEGSAIDHYFISIPAVLAPTAPAPHNWQPDPSGHRQPHEVPWSIASFPNSQTFVDPELWLLAVILIAAYFAALMLMKIRKRRLASLVEVDTEREIETR